MCKAPPLSVAAALKQYKYEAPKLSLLETLYLDKFWNLMAQHVYPPWLAPNLITMGGGMCIMLAAINTSMHSPALRGESPHWVYAVNALLLFLYQTLDGSDGKQARKTQTGSALGELMDHGIDSWTVAPIALVVVDAFAFGIESPWPWLCLLGAQSLFLFSNMTLFHIGCMRVNKVDVMELQSTMYVSLLLTSYYGPDLWKTNLPFGIKADYENAKLGIDWREGVSIRDGLCVLTFVVMISNAIATSTEVLSALASPEEARKWSRKAPPPCRGYWPYCRQMGYIMSHVALVSACYATVVSEFPLKGDTPSSIPSKERTAADALFWLLLLTSFAFAGDLMRLLACRVGHIPLPKVSRGLVCLLAYLLCLRQGWHSAEAMAMPVGMAAMSTVGFFVFMTREISSALNMHPFRVKGAKHWYKLQ